MKVFHSTKDSMNKTDREAMDQRYVFAMAITKKDSYLSYTHQQGNGRKLKGKMSKEDEHRVSSNRNPKGWQYGSLRKYLFGADCKTDTILYSWYIHLPEPKSPALKGLTLYSGGSGGMTDRH